MRLYLLTFVILLFPFITFAASTNDGDAAYANGDIKAAIKLWALAAGQGSHEAESRLCATYYNGDGVEQSYPKAVDWCKKAAEGGDIGSQFAVGTIYEYGHGLKEDKAQALKWFEKVADQGDLYSQAHVGAMYAEGIGTKKDVVQAYKWLTLAYDANEKYYGWSAVVNEMTSKQRSVSQDLETDLSRLAASMTSGEIKQAKDIAQSWEDNYRQQHPVKRRFSPLLIFGVFFVPALAMASIKGRQQRFHFFVRVATWISLSALLFVPWFFTWSHGENLQNAFDAWMKVFAWTGGILATMFYLTRRCSSEHVSFIDGLMFAVNSLGIIGSAGLFVAIPLLAVILLASLGLSLFNEVTGRAKSTSMQYSKLVGFIYRNRHEAEK